MKVNRSPPALDKFPIDLSGQMAQHHWFGRIIVVLRDVMLLDSGEPVRQFPFRIGCTHGLTGGSRLLILPAPYKLFLHFGRIQCMGEVSPNLIAGMKAMTVPRKFTIVLNSHTIAFDELDIALFHHRQLSEISQAESRFSELCATVDVLCRRNSSWIVADFRLLRGFGATPRVG